MLFSTTTIPEVDVPARIVSDGNTMRPESRAARTTFAELPTVFGAPETAVGENVDLTVVVTPTDDEPVELQLLPTTDNTATRAANRPDEALLTHV